MTSPQKSKEPEGGASQGLSMDIGQIKSLIDLMVDNDLSRMELREGETHILLRRGHPYIVPPTLPAHVTPAPSGSDAQAPAGTPPAAIPNEVLIRSPMVGTFYASADPDSPPFVGIGSQVGPDTIVCLIEAMKVFNELKAEVSGQITKVLVKNAQAIEFDQPLYAVAPA